MTIVAPVGQYPEGLQGFGHVPGVRGGAIGTGAKIISKLTYRGTKYLARRFFKPKAYTYRGATARGIGAGTLVASLLQSPDIDDLDGTIPTTDGQKTNQFRQGNRRRRVLYRSGRNNNRLRHRCCC